MRAQRNLIFADFARTIHSGTSALLTRDWLDSICAKPTRYFSVAPLVLRLGRKAIITSADLLREGASPTVSQDVPLLPAQQFSCSMSKTVKINSRLLAISGLVFMEFRLGDQQ